MAILHPGPAGMPGTAGEPEFPPADAPRGNLLAGESSTSGSSIGYLALAIVCIGAFMGQLDATIVTVALPTLERAFHTSLTTATWVSLVYLVVLVGGVAIVGRLADLVGRTTLYTIGFLVFAAGSGMCAVAPDMTALLGFRVLQAVGAALLQANSVAIIYHAVPRERLGRAIGLQGSAQALGLAFGPTIAGILIGAGGWRLIFFVSVPVGILGAVTARLWLPSDRTCKTAEIERSRDHFDWTGAALLATAVISVLVTMTLGSRWGWTSVHTLTLAAAGVTLTTLWVGWERRTTSPLVDLALLRNRHFAAGSVVGMISYTVLFGAMLAVPLYLERMRGASATTAGLQMTVLPLVLGTVAPFAGRLSERIGTRWPAVLGTALAIAGLLSMGRWPEPGAPMTASLALLGLGLGMVIAPNSAAVMRAAPFSQAGVASGLLNMTRGLGTALGLAITGSAMASMGARLPQTSSFSGTFTTTCIVLATLVGVAMVLSAMIGPTRDRDPRSQVSVDVAPSPF